MPRFNPQVSNILTALIFGFAYFISFEIFNRLQLVNDFATGVSLIYLPAGVKLVAALVGGFYGVLGTVFALMYLAHQYWTDQPLVFMVLTACISGFSTLLAVRVMKKIMRIADDLSNLKLTQLPVLDLISTMFHGLVLNGLWIWFSVEKTSDFLLRAGAMAVGDFMGSMILLLALAFALKLNQKFFSTQSS